MNSHEEYAEMYARMAPALTGPTNTEYGQMKTNEMITDLVAKGFTLPEGLVYEIADGVSWFLQNHSGTKIWHLESGQQQIAYDAIACAFARRVESMVDGARAIGRSGFGTLMRMGDSEAAINALWQAVCDA